MRINFVGRMENTTFFDERDASKIWVLEKLTLMNDELQKQQIGYVGSLLADEDSW